MLNLPSIPIVISVVYVRLLYWCKYYFFRNCNIFVVYTIDAEIFNVKLGYTFSLWNICFIYTHRECKENKNLEQAIYVLKINRYISDKEEDLDEIKDSIKRSNFVQQYLFPCSEFEDKDWKKKNYLHLYSILLLFNTRAITSKIIFVWNNEKLSFSFPSEEGSLLLYWL